jgi:transcriptional regulator with PAS, ATPase and Fis domain
MDRFVAHEWIGNVRELENEIERAVALAGDEESIGVDMLSEELRGAPSAAVAPDPTSDPIHDWDLNSAVDTLKRRMILESLRATGSKTRAAERLGIPRQSLQKMMKRLALGEEDVPRD